MASFSINNTTYAGSFNFYDFLNPKHTVVYAYAKDINGDGADEVIFAGIESQPNTPATYTDTSVHIFGWVDGVFAEITNQWLPNGTNKVQGVGDVAFGDFNGDGRVDVFLTANKDMDATATPYALLNQGSSFQRVAMSSAMWQHAVASADVNQDGYDDVFTTGYMGAPKLYFGSANGLRESSFSGDAYGSGIALGDFLGNGTMCVVLVDHHADQGKDTALYKINNGNLEFVSALPKARLDRDVYGTTSDPLGQSHDVRARSMDFNHDGLLDVLVFSRMSWNGRQWPEISEIQFLKNLGNGQFQDVTDSTLLGYRIQSNVSYAPVIVDLNGDGLEDLYLSEAAFSNDGYDSTAILLQQKNGTFVEVMRDELSALVFNEGNVSTVARGPDGTYYVVAANTVNDLEVVSTSQLTPNASSYEPVIPEVVLPPVTIENTWWGNDWDERILDHYDVNDLIYGKSGLDYVLYQDASSNYSIKIHNGYTLVTRGSESDVLVDSVERIQFSNTAYALDVSGIAGEAYRIYKAAFDRIPDTGGLGFWINAMDHGSSLSSVAAGFISSPEFQQLYGANVTDRDFVTKVYTNVLDRNPDQSGYDFWLGAMVRGATRADILASFSESPENINNVADLIANGIRYQEWLG